MPLPDALLGERLNIPFVTAKAPMRGNPKGPVEILYFTAVGCSYECDKAASVLAGLLTTYGEQVRVIAKLVPWGGGRDTPPVYTEAALAAHAQGKFWEFHDKLTKESGFPPPDRAKLESLAQAAGLDVEDFRAGNGRRPLPRGRAGGDGRHQRGRRSAPRPSWSTAAWPTAPWPWSSWSRTPSRRPVASRRPGPRGHRLRGPTLAPPATIPRGW
jgi:hypothetical protein